MFVRHMRSVTDIKYLLTFKQGYNDCQSIPALCWTPYKDLNGFYFLVRHHPLHIREINQYSSQKNQTKLIVFSLL